MKKKISLTNKYTLSVLIMLAYLATDIILHKGMSRAMLPASFTNMRIPQDFSKCEQPLFVKGKKWIKAVNTVKKIELLTTGAAGLEIDVYFDETKNYLHVYHDSAGYSQLNIEAILKVYQARKLSSSIWLDFKNLSAANEKQSLKYISFLRLKYKLQNKIIIESSFPEFLQSFCDSGFFTSYYTPFFNPYLCSQEMLNNHIDNISNVLNKYKVCALSGYYFQYPALKKYFPGYPILTWSDNTNFSFITNYFNRKLLNDTHVKVVLFP